MQPTNDRQADHEQEATVRRDPWRRAQHTTLMLWTAQTKATTELLGRLAALPLRTGVAAWAKLAAPPARPRTTEPAVIEPAVIEPAVTELAVTELAVIESAVEPAGAPAVERVDVRVDEADDAPEAEATVDVTFRVPAEAAALSACVSGEFNDWSTTTDPMDRLDDGSFELTRTLPVGRSWRFRYLVDGIRWENDADADDYPPNEFGDRDSVVDLTGSKTSRLVLRRVAVG